VLGEAVKDGEKVGRITGVVTTPEEQEGVKEFGIGVFPQKQQQYPRLLFRMNPGITG